MRRCLLAGLLLTTACDQVLGLELPEIPDAPEVGVCPPGFDDLGYLLVVEPAGWSAAESACRNLEDDGRPPYTHLVVLGDAAEIMPIRRRSTEQVWVGLSWIGVTADARTRDDWAWITREDTAPPAWELDQPNNLPPPQNCGQLTETGFSDRGCDELRAYVCECDDHPVVLDRI